MRPALAALVLLLALPARATFVRQLMDRADTEPLFDSEYFLDLRAFSDPRAWRDAWAASTGGYRVNAASLDCCDLLLDQGLLFSRRLTPRLEFRFRYTDWGDKERQETHHWLELETALGRGWSVELFGEPSFRKEDADIGLGVRWRRDGRQFRWRRNAVDFNFNSRGSTSQRYSLKPWTDELLLESAFAPGTARVWAELDAPTRRDDPAARRSFFYRREVFGAAWESDAGPRPRLAYSYERQERLDRYATSALGTSTDARRRAHQAEGTLRLDLDDRTELEPGLAVLRRSVRADDPFSPSSGLTRERWEVHAWTRWRRELGSVLTGELSPFAALGERSVRGPWSLSRETLVELKLVGGLEWRFAAAGRIGVNANFDLDAPGKPWDGGNVRAMFLF